MQKRLIFALGKTGARPLMAPINRNAADDMPKRNAGKSGAVACDMGPLRGNLKRDKKIFKKPLTFFLKLV